MDLATESKIHTHSSGEAGIFANAYAIEIGKSVVVIDASLTVSEARSFGRLLNSLGKPIAAVLITHAHPDHIAGLSVWLPHNRVPIYALQSVTDLLASIEVPKRKQWQPVFKDEWVPSWRLPNETVRSGERLRFDGVEFEVVGIGPGGDCDANSIWMMSGETSAAFVGDLVFNGTHSYLADGHTNEWLRNLDRTKELVQPGMSIYPGHGGPGNQNLFEEQARYLRAYRDAVADLSDGKPSLCDSARVELERRMQRFVPANKLAFMVGLSADTVLAEVVTAKR